MRASSVIDADIQSLQAEIGEVELRLNELANQPFGTPEELGETFDLYQTLYEKTRELETLKRENRDAQHRELNAYKRPSTGFLGLLSRPLGPLPEDHPFIDVDKHLLRSVPRQWPLAFGLITTVLIALAALVTFVPWMRISPYLLIHNLLEPYTGGFTTAVTIGISIVLNALLTFGLGPRRQGFAGVIVSFAMREEQWFRMGAESWSTGRRLYSCVSFGAMHVINMIYPIASLLVLSGVGAVFMWAYLREYKRSHDVIRATLVSAKLHATYNRFAFGYGAILLMLTGAAYAWLHFFQ